MSLKNVANRAQSSLLYTDHMIHSPRVPWFRTRGRDAPDRVCLASVITAPAPNAGEVLARDPGAGPRNPAMVSDAFGAWLASDTFAGAFDHVTFAVFDRTKRVHAAFAERFSA